jgi:hypothetical protein
MGQYEFPKGEKSQILSKNLASPASLTPLDPMVAKRNEICSLFGTQRQSVREIARIQNVDHHTVVQVLFEKGLIRERRKNLSSMRDRERRRSLLKAYIAGLEIDPMADM